MPSKVVTRMRAKLAAQKEQHAAPQKRATLSGTSAADIIRNAATAPAKKSVDNSDGLGEINATIEALKATGKQVDDLTA